MVHRARWADRADHHRWDGHRVRDSDRGQSAARDHVGPDGALWFTEGDSTGSDKIGRITTAGAITETAIPTAYAAPAGIALGSDGALWFTESVSNKIGRITTAGAITETTIPTTNSGPLGIAAGSDRALWFTEAVGQGGRITTDGGPPPPGPPPPTPAPGPAPAPGPGPAPTPGPGPLLKPGLAVADGTAKVTGGKAGVLLSCPHGTSGCSGTLALTVRQRVTVRRHGCRTTVTRTVTVGRARFNVAAGARRTFQVSLSQSARSSLTHAPSHRVRVTAAIGHTHKTITLVQPKPRGKRRKR